MNEYLLRLTPADLAVIDQGLQEVKMRLASPLVAKMNAQIAAQQQAAAEASRPSTGEEHNGDRHSP